MYVIAPIMGVCAETVKRRIFEFKQTKAANLTIEEFERIDLIKDIQFESNPPCFKSETPLNPIEDSKTIIENIRTKISQENLHKISLEESKKDSASEDTIETLSQISDSEIDSYI